ncbi:MAG: FGGY family carbohydrate kinase [Planctomycetota bacterium]|nr:FGGY family carbohydrate kinase [Planctomycetota bacterium]
MDYLVGIDLGSTSLKAVVYNVNGKVLASASRPTERFHPDAAHPDWTVWQPEQIWGGTADALREAIAKLDNPRNVKGVAVTGMGMDGVPLDADGKWLYPFISWLDPRTAPQLEWWTKHIGTEKTFGIGGNPVWAINSALRILWMKEHEPQILARTDKWLLIEDFLNFMLCGRRATDYSMASCTMLFDQRRLTWSDEMLKLSGIDKRLMPDAHPSGTVLGEVHAAAAKATGLPEGTPVVLGGHDHLCGALPVGAFWPGVVLDVTGTWEIVSTSIPRPVLTPQVHKAGLTIQAHVGRNVHAAWASTPAGESLEWFRNQLCSRQPGDAKTAEDWETLMGLAAQSAPGAGGVLFLPHLSGSTCPVVDAHSKGCFAGLRSMTTKGDLIRAIIEGLDYQFLDMLTSFASGLGTTMERIVAVGGATKNEFWMQNKADVVGKTIEAPEIEEATPLGAAILAGVGVGVYKSEQDAYDKVYKPGRVYKPNAAHARTYARGFELYRQLYPALRTVNAKA